MLSDTNSDSLRAMSADDEADGETRLSPMIESLFPPGVVAVEFHGDGDPAQLLESERRQIVGAMPKRVREFAAGRTCARAALDVFGMGGHALLRAADRTPTWPAAIVGSLSHSTRFCVAVVAGRDQFRGLGVDVEDIGPVTEELWPRICVPSELRWLRSRAKAERANAATLIFSAKEAFYKCQYTLSRHWLDFTDVQLDLDRSDLSAGQFVIGTISPQKQNDATFRVSHGRFCLGTDRIVTGVAWPR